MVPDGETAASYLRFYRYEVAVLDWRMPRLSGLDLIRRLRRGGTPTPVLMLTARDTPADRIAGLDAGADDYLVKPFDFGELLARLRALQRRPPVAQAPRLAIGELELDPAAREVRIRGQRPSLTAIELGILELLMRRQPGIADRRSIAQHVWDDEADAFGSNTIDVHLARLRSKLASAGVRIETVRGVGYRIVAAPGSASPTSSRARPVRDQAQQTRSPPRLDGIACPSWPKPQVDRRYGRLRPSGPGQDGDEVPGPAHQVLVGRAVLARHRDGEPAARPACSIQLDPFGVDVEFHRDPRPAAGQRVGQVGGGGGHARGVYQVAGGVLAQGAAGDVLHRRPGWRPTGPSRPPPGSADRLSTSSCRFCRTLYTASPGAGRPRAQIPIRARPERSITRLANPAPQRADHVALLLVSRRRPRTARTRR